MGVDLLGDFRPCVAVKGLRQWWVDVQRRGRISSYTMNGRAEAKTAALRESGSVNTTSCRKVSSLSIRVRETAPENKGTRIESITS